MTKNYYIVCNKYRKFKNPDKSKTLYLSIACSKCGHEYKKIF